MAFPGKWKEGLKPAVQLLVTHTHVALQTSKKIGRTEPEELKRRLEASKSSVQRSLGLLVFPSGYGSKKRY